MNKIPSYAKIQTLGALRTENALVGEVIVQEKVDGSQFRFGIDDNKKLIIASKRVTLGHADENKMFKKGFEYIISIKDKLLEFGPHTYFYAEFLNKPKHNVLKYERVPKNNIVLFDVVINGAWVERPELERIARELDIDVVPELYRGNLSTSRVNKSSLKVSSPAVDHLKRIIETTQSYLGRELVEGVVIKNYNQTITLGNQLFPLFTKYVRESFKERHDVEWKIKSPKNSLQDFVSSFRSEARWQKAIIHLKEKGVLETSPRDIGKLIQEVQNDIKEEEIDNIKNTLYNKFIRDILRVSVRGLPEWYKEKLLENLNEENSMESS